MSITVIIWPLGEVTGFFGMLGLSVEISTVKSARFFRRIRKVSAL
jgi:hypothetical protein